MSNKHKGKLGKAATKALKNSTPQPLPITPPLSPNPPTREKVELIKLASIHNKFDVRKELDQDRVLQFASMYQSGEVNLPPVEVVRISPDGETMDADAIEYAYIDGRHRGAARAYLNLTDVPAVVRNGSLRDDPAALYARALEANWGGAKPPTRADITHTIQRMLENGVPRTEVSAILTFLPKGALRGYLADALSLISKRRIAKALDDIQDGLGLETAARRNNVKPETLRDILAGKKGKWGKSRSDEVQYITEMKQYVSRTAFAANTGISKKVLFMLQRVEDGEISGAAARKVVDYWKDHVAKTSLRIADWQARLESIIDSQNKTVGRETEPKIEKPADQPMQASSNSSRAIRVKTIKRTADDAIDYVGVRMDKGFWNEELPKAIRATGKRQARPLLEYFEQQGKLFTFKQVEGALARLKGRGLDV